MRKLLALCAIAAAAVLVPADVSAAPVEATLSGSITQSGGFLFTSFARIEGVGTVSAVGRVSFVADWRSGCFRRDCTSEQVVLTAKNGDTLMLAGGIDASDSGGLIVPWSVVGGTGRFASASGNGTFSFNFDPTATIALTGTLSR